MKEFTTKNGKTVAIMQQHYPTESTINNCAVNIVKSHSGKDVHIIGGYIVYDGGYTSDYVCGSYEDILEYAMLL